VSTSSTQTIQVPLPELGESVTEGTIIEWRVAEGATVAAGDILLDLTTDKVDVEVPAPAAGRLVSILAQAGDTVEIGTALAEIDTSGDGAGPEPEGAPAAEAPAEEASGERVAIVLPEMESVTEGVVIEWRVGEGDAVAADQVVVEVSTDKVDIEVPAPASGVLVSVAVPAGETFPITTPLGEIASGPAPTPSPEPAAAPPDAAPAPPPRGGGAPAADLPEWPSASPLARRLAAQRGVDLTGVAGSGPGGMVRRRDVPATADAAAAPRAASATERAVALRGPAAALADYMDQSLAIPTATSFRTLAVGPLDAQRRSINEALAAAGGGGGKLSFTHLIAWAIVRAGEAWPGMGTGYQVIDGKPHRLERDAINLGLAVDVERKDGTRSLLVPVVLDAGARGFAGFRDAFDDLVGRTRDGKIAPDELRGATITLTNPGGLGTVASVPRLMPGQGTIVAAGALGYPPGLAGVRPEALRDLGVEKVLTLTSTYDHRVIQGAESGAFLAEIERLLDDDTFYDDARASLGLETAPAQAQAPAPSAPATERRVDLDTPFPDPLAEGELTGQVDAELLGGVAAAMSLVRTYRSHGHLAAELDPLGKTPAGDPALKPESLSLTPELMARINAQLLRVKVPGKTFADALPHLREAYSGTIAYEIEHISDHQQRLWLRSAIESGRYRGLHSPDRRLATLERLVRVDVFERFLRRTYLGQKTFSIEGVDALVPIVDEVLDQAAESGIGEALIGMAHRGRLAFIAHVVGRPAEEILAEFEGHMAFEAEGEDDAPLVTAGDVKYHLGADGTFSARSGKRIRVSLSANPSHLEQVNPVVEGEARAHQTSHIGSEVALDTNLAMPVLVHGDAAFTGQGVVAETLNLANLPGYTTGGTVHIIANNQIGFTTDPPDSRSTQSTSDLARGFDIPVIHVNADDIDACVSAARLAFAFRQRYHRDALINLIGYRRLGHNELDEPAYTQPVMARTIKEHPPVSELYAKRLIDEGVIDRAAYDRMREDAERDMTAAHAAVTARGDLGRDLDTQIQRPTYASRAPVKTAISEGAVRSLNEQLLAVPEDFSLHPKLSPQLERRRQALDEGGVTWAQAESLALASLLVDGVPVRFTGQDTARGTFSHRHLRLHDVGEDESWSPRTGDTHTPMAQLLRAKASFELHNSPLSEAATLGFEYGYSTAAPEALVLWEAQYGDFANGGQIMIDQFIVSGRAKWGERSRLTLLLPHGYEGNGPEHSSARMERFLQAAAEDNVRLANLSTSAQYFHLLRGQALTDRIRPLVIFTPKSLLRAKSAASPIEAFGDGHFMPVLDDPAQPDPAGVRRLLLCTGKVFHDLSSNPAYGDRDDIAILRLEQLYPFPEPELREVLDRYDQAVDYVWVQEEPRNMGGWEFLRRQLNRAATGSGLPRVRYVGRARRASPSEGYPQAHQIEQERLLAEALSKTTNGATE